MFQISARIQKAELAPAAALCGMANAREMTLPSGVRYAVGTLQYVKFDGTRVADGSYVGHQSWDVLDEPAAPELRADLSHLIEFTAGQQASDAHPPLLGSDPGPESESESEERNMDQADDESVHDGDNG